MNKLNFTSKSNGDILNASEWNALAEKTDELVQAINDGAGSGSGEIDTNGVVSVNSKGNTTISSTKHINIEPAYVVDGGSGTYGDVQIKPGDDITLESHHRAEDKRDEITIKTSNGQDGASKAPVKLQVIAADMTLSTKGKQVASDSNDSSNVMNVNVTTGNGKGYLKVRAQAIDLRCEEHGGIALQPKGTDDQGNMNKIKFEHGGGDGLEFGTFNTEKTSIFTDEYRFNREGVWKMATRTKVASDKADENDPTTAYKYVKAADDFYDNIAQDDEQCTTKDIIKTAYAMNGGKDRHTKITKKGAIEISTNATYQIHFGLDENWTAQPANISTISTKIASEILSVSQPPVVFEGKVYNAGDFDNDALPDTTGTVGYECGRGYFVSFTEIPAPDIKIDSGAGLKLGGILDFGSSFNFGETDGGIEVQNKYTKKGTFKDCGKLKVIAVNNNSSAYTFNTLWDPTANSNAGGSVTETTVSVPAGESVQIAEASIYDIIKLVNYMKANNEGPWATNP
jgi:hypothetical protein